jgi:hypothetical protein
MRSTDMSKEDQELPSRTLARLISAGDTSSALALCETWASHEVIGAYYARFRERLLAAGLPTRTAEQPRALAADRSVSKDAIGQLGAALRQDFRDAPYVMSTEETSTETDWAALRDQLVSSSPFRGEIYQPTAKISLRDQVRGLRRVRELVQPGNLSATHIRFERLRQRIRDAGVRRVFVIGNGPSLKKIDLSLLRDEITIGFNGIFLHDSFVPTIYVVEDHLVAEDRQQEIHAYQCPVKVFPSYLGYCLDPQHNTIFLNHRPRISYPVDTDFSHDVGTISYTGGTVTYTGLQIAASLGVEQIILVGVDASYTVADVERNETYGTGVLTSKSEDTNHFDPRYFGAGYRWHDPNVHTMLQAYRKALDHGRRHGLEIVNATAGGQLEVFPRADFYQLMGERRSSPRLAVIDFTASTRLCATGRIKQNLLRGWAKSSLLHVASESPGQVNAFRSIRNDVYTRGVDDKSLWPALRSLLEFDPDVLYLRPTADRVLMTLVQTVAATLLNRPFVVHYMDDWLARLQGSAPPSTHSAYVTILRYLFQQAHRVLSISSKMSAQLTREHGLSERQTAVVHNFITPVAASGPKTSTKGTCVIRYFGGIEPDMGLATLLDCAHQVEAMAKQRDVKFEIFTTPHGISRHGAAFEQFQCTAIKPQLEDDKDYFRELSSADLNLICYNFDEPSVRYVRYSLANKLPDLLSVETPFIAIGHHDIGTIGLLQDCSYPLLSTAVNFDLDALVREAMAPSAAQQAALEQARATLMTEFSDEGNRIRFQAILRSAAASPAPSEVPPLEAVSTLLRTQQAKWPANLAEEAAVLVRLPGLPAALIAAFVARLRSHGLDWSIRDEVLALAKLVPTAQSLQQADTALQARCLATLVCALGVDRYEKVNSITRAWVLGS